MDRLIDSVISGDPIAVTMLLREAQRRNVDLMTIIERSMMTDICRQVRENLLDSLLLRGYEGVTSRIDSIVKQRCAVGLLEQEGSEILLPNITIQGRIGKGSCKIQTDPRFFFRIENMNPIPEEIEKKVNQIVLDYISTEVDRGEDWPANRWWSQNHRRVVVGLRRLAPFKVEFSQGIWDNELAVCSDAFIGKDPSECKKLVRLYLLPNTNLEDVVFMDPDKDE